MKCIDKVERLTQEILDLQEQSEALRDQIYLLESREAKIADSISAKRKQLDTLKLFEKE